MKGRAVRIQTDSNLTARGFGAKTAQQRSDDFSFFVETQAAVGASDTA